MNPELVNLFTRDRAYLIESLRRDPRTFAATLYSESTTGPFWNRQLTTYSPYLTMNSTQLCCLIGAQPQAAKTTTTGNLCLYSTIQPLGREGKQSETFVVTTGRVRQPQNFILKVFDLEDTPQARFFDTSLTSLSRLGQRPENQICLYPNLQNLKFIGSDNFTNEYLIGFILDILYSTRSQKPTRAAPPPPTDGASLGLNGVIRFLSATICNIGTKRRGTILMEYADLGDIYNFVRNPLAVEFREVKEYLDANNNPIRLHSLLPTTIVDICKQMVANLDFLHTQVEFNHGDLKVNNVLLDSTPSQGNYQGLSWNSNFTLKIADFGKSSLTVVDKNKQRIRLFNYSSAADNYLGVFPFRPSLGTQFNEPYYQIDTISNLTALVRIRHMGIPYFLSFDLYTFIISLLLIPEIFFPVMTDERLRRVLWDPLWFQDEASEAFTRLYNAMIQRKENTYDTILTVLDNLKLKCRANTLLLDSLKTLNL